MSDIFISYASEDKGRVQALARALERKGWSVWWDRRIPAGKSFDEVIHEALKTARSVVVVWTKTSVKSTWVKNESRSGLRRNILFPVMLLEEVEIPLEFEHLQAAHLLDWQPDQEHAGFEQFLDDLAGVIGVPSSAAVQPPPVTQREEPPPAPLGRNNNLQGLTVSPGSLAPAFDEHVQSYTVNVAATVGTVTMTPTLSDSAATMTVNGQATDSGQAQTIVLNGPGSNTVRCFYG